jgi:hypothetical protein
VIYVGTVGEGLWQGEDGRRWSLEAALGGDARVYALTVSADGGLFYAGARGGVWRREGGRWRHLPLPDPALEVWSLAVHPAAPRVVFAGCRPLTLFAWADEGTGWQPLTPALPPGTPEPHTPRVTAILLDPDRPGTLWTGVEVGGVFEARDGGRAWRPTNDGLPSLDIHALARATDGTLLAATPRGLAALRAGRWSPAPHDHPDRYFRALAPAPWAPRTFFAGLGDGPPGTRGTVLVSEDDGGRWTPTPFPGSRSTVWSLATDAREPGLVVAGAIGGEVFLSRDGGRAWSRAGRDFAEVRAVAVAP